MPRQITRENSENSPASPRKTQLGIMIPKNVEITDNSLQETELLEGLSPVL